MKLRKRARLVRDGVEDMERDYGIEGLVRESQFVHIHLEGITAQLPYVGNFTAMMEDTDSVLRKEPMNADAELMLTAQYFNFARHVWEGVGADGGGEVGLVFGAQEARP